MTSFSPKTNGVTSTMASPRRRASSPQAHRYGRSAYNYLRFAEANYVGGNDTTFSRFELKGPLLPGHTETDALAAQAIFKVMLKFMGDMADYRADMKKTYQPNMGSVMTRLYENLGIASKEAYLKKRDMDDLASSAGPVTNGNTGTLQKPANHEEQMYAQLAKQSRRRSGGTFSRLKATLHQRVFKERPATPWSRLPLEESLRTSLDQIHFIIGYAIIRVPLRDEIYCQVCKQLTDNPYKTSIARGWMLFLLCTGCFPPSQKLLPVIKAFLDDGPPMYTSHCKRYLQQIIANGARFQPPAYLEMECAERKQLLELPVTLMDGTTHAVVVDPNTTSKGLTSKLAEQIGLRERFGFSVFIAISDKVASLGNGSDHVMDSISQCEQIWREQEGVDEAAPWQLFLRKEMFAPWDSATSDCVATNLVYAQVVRGIVLEEYICEDDQQLATLAAQQYYIENGSEYGTQIHVDHLLALLPAYVPERKCVDEETTTFWLENIMREYNRMFSRGSDRDAMLPSIEKVKQEVVYFAKTKFSIEYSRCYDVQILQGPEWPIEDLVLAVNWTGVYIMDDGDIIYELSYIEVASVASNTKQEASGDSLTTVTFTLLTGDKLQLKCEDAHDIRHLVQYMLTGLRQKSTFAVALENYEGISKENISLQEGDLVILDKPPGERGLDLKGLTSGCNDRTGQQGHFPTILIYVLNSLCRPSEDICNIFKITKLKNSIKKMNLHTKHNP